MAKPKDQNNKIELSQLKAIFASEMIVVNRKLQETQGSLEQLMRLHNEMMKQLEKKPEKEEKTKKKEQ